MASSLKIKQGTKLTMSFDVPAGKEPDFCIVTTFFKELNEASFLVSIPLKGGRPMPISDTQKLLIRYDNGPAPMILAGFVDATVKQGLRSYWKVHRVTEQRTFFQRTDTRYKLAIRVNYIQPTWPANMDGVIEPEEGLTLDISAGGLALYLNRVFEVGEVCEVTLPAMGKTKAGQSTTVLAESCWCRKTQKGSAYKNLCGLKFRIKDEKEKKHLNDYMKVVEKYSA